MSPDLKPRDLPLEEPPKTIECVRALTNPNYELSYYQCDVPGCGWRKPAQEFEYFQALNSFRQHNNTDHCEDRLDNHIIRVYTLRT